MFSEPSFFMCVPSAFCLVSSFHFAACFFFLLGNEYVGCTWLNMPQKKSDTLMAAKPLGESSSWGPELSLLPPFTLSRAHALALAYALLRWLFFDFSFFVFWMSFR
jgi:hypothetical protein